jgi:hypothetical protein
MNASPNRTPMACWRAIRCDERGRRQLDATNDSAALAWREQLAAIERRINDLDNRRGRLLQPWRRPTTLAACSPTTSTGGSQRSLRNRCSSAVNFNSFATTRPSRTTAHICSVHATAAKLAGAPDAMLRQLFEACALTVHYHPHSRLNTSVAVIKPAAVPVINQAAAAAGAPSAGGDELGMLAARSEGFEPPTF